MRVLHDELGLEVADAIMFNAMRMAGTGAIPEDPAGVLFFVLGSLDVAVERRVGRNTADEILAELEPVLTDARERAAATAYHSGVAPKSEPSFPAVTTVDETLVESGVHPRVEAEASPATLPAEVGTIVVVSADGRERDGLRRRLQQQGHRVVAARDGHVGLALCVRYEPDVVICDLDMPRVSGRELVSSLKLALGDHRPRIILLTPSVVDPIPDVTYQVPKPVHPQVLRHLIKASLAGQA
ncbi:MAG: response regulator [Polyangiaceae bacterium]